MIQRYARLNGTRWLDLWLITKVKLSRSCMSYLSIGAGKILNDEEQNLGEQELPPSFYHIPKPSASSKGFSLSLRNLKKLFSLRKKNAVHVEEMDQEIQQMEKMLSKLQTINEVISSNEATDECVLEDVINRILDKLQTSIIERNIFVRIYAESDISFFTKPRLLYVILENLIENAVYYSSSGSSQSYVEINLKKEGKGLLIGIEDNGIGIRRESCDKIFNIFYKDSDLSNGGGLGLYIVREALQKLEGKIEFESEEGCFTKIEVHIPSAQMQRNQPKKDTEPMSIEDTQSV
jgi:signal transduction histidine kinase